jgi:hypothetical protein
LVTVPITVDSDEPRRASLRIVWRLTLNAAEPWPPLLVVGAVANDCSCAAGALPISSWPPEIPKVTLPSL